MTQQPLTLKTGISGFFAAIKILELKHLQQQIYNFWYFLLLNKLFKISLKNLQHTFMIYPFPKKFLKIIPQRLGDELLVNKNCLF